MANSNGSDAKSNSRRCFTFVNVTTPTAPRAVLPTKFAVAEKHMSDFSPARGLHQSSHNAKYFLGFSDWICRKREVETAASGRAIGGQTRRDLDSRLAAQPETDPLPAPALN